MNTCSYHIIVFWAIVHLNVILKVKIGRSLAKCERGFIQQELRFRHHILAEWLLKTSFLLTAIFTLSVFESDTSPGVSGPPTRTPF
jgi:hypothetical protein